MPFDPKRIPHHFADVLIIGGGIAGLRAAMEIDPRLSLLVITKDTMEQSNSAYAQGGIASVIDPDDNFFDDLYAPFTVRRVTASRMINSVAGRRGKITEILVTNYLRFLA